MLPLGALRARGADARAFLQGQLSCDVTRLATGRSLGGGYHNPQGRVVALLRLVELAADDIIALLPGELVTTVALRLQKFVLRSKVKIEDASASFAIRGLIQAPPGAPGLPQAADEASAHPGGGIAVRIRGPAARWLLRRRVRSASRRAAAGRPTARAPSPCGGWR